MTLYVLRYSLPCPLGHLHHFAVVLDVYELALLFWTTALAETPTATLCVVLPDGSVGQLG